MQESGDHAAEQSLHQADGTRHAHRALRLRPRAIDRFLRGERFGFERRAVLVVGLADLRDGDLARRALEQPHAELLLQLADMAAELRGLQAEGGAAAL